MFVTDNTAKQRYRVCLECEHFRPLARICDDHGGFMPTRVRVLEVSCPYDKWGAKLDGMNGEY